ncbi:MAG TPA: hypothetical protein PLJ35_05075 [Anaerolineae bacterium]|nr:hypothetical protein [Anaerolineae bacterium]HOQ98173.1 hypothetical protein [Anaerolineae bacterium]
MRVTLRNDFHNSESTVVVPALPAVLTSSQTRKVRRELCGVSGCECGGVRGPQSHNGHRLDVEPTNGVDGMMRWRVAYRYPEEVE